MKKLALIACVLLAAAVVPAALGKGASEATITGPGLDEPLTLAGEGQEGGETLLGIAEQAGFFAAVFGQSPDRMLASRPKRTLGPRYVVRYEMPGPNNELDTIVQHLYPYARPHPVSYTPPGQRFWTTEETRGGWFVAYYSTLKDDLVAAGLPSSPPTGTAGDGRSWPRWELLLAAVAGASLILALAAALRRRPQTRTVTASRSAS